jgi:hypothetical protein
MKIFLTDQTSKFSRHLSDLKSTKVMPYDKNLLTEKISSVPLDLEFSRANLESLFNYEIFPSNILTFRTQWQEERRQMKTGDTILQQVFIPPFRTFSQKIIFGVRISEIIDTADKKGFSYETLAGHVEKGISTFTVERSGDSAIFKIHTFSQPGNILTKILGPIFSVPYQTFCTKTALKNVKWQIELK